MTAIVQSIPLTILFESQCIQGFYSAIAQRRLSCGGAYPPSFRPAFDRLTQAKHQRFVICQFDLTEAEKYVPNEFATKSRIFFKAAPSGAARRGIDPSPRLFEVAARRCDRQPLLSPEFFKLLTSRFRYYARVSLI